MFARLVDLAKQPASRRDAYLVAATIGVVIHLATFGFAHVLGSSPYWDMPYEDFRAYLIGYRYFLHEPWHLPIFTVHGMNLPFPKSIAMTDSIPLWSAINKAIATVIPPWGPFSSRAFLGLWGAVVAGLQGVAGLLCLRGLGQRSWVGAIFGTLFFVALPTFIYRYGHSSLSAHFILLVALALYLRAPARGPAGRAFYGAFVALLAASALVNVYLVAMSFAIFVALLLRSRDLKTMLLWAPAALGSIVFFGWFAGFLSSEATTPMGGFEWSSANVLSPVIPVRSGIFGDARWIAEVIAAPYQYEGYAYLGAGVLLLVVLFLPRVKEVGPVVRRHPWLFAIAAGAALFSLSNHVYFGSHRILTIELTGGLKRLTEVFRAPGRFVWIPTYVLLVFLVRWALETFTTGWRFFVVPALALLQLADASGDMKSWRDQTRTTFPHLLHLDGWRSLEAAHQAVLTAPPYDCALDGTPHVDRVGMELGYLSSESGVGINGVYSARSTRDCLAEERAWAQAVPRERTLHVFLPRTARHAYRFEALGATCGKFDYGRACSLAPATIDAAVAAGALRPNAPPPALAFGQAIEIGREGDAAFLDYGYAAAEPAGRWTIGSRATILFRLTGEAPEHPKLKVRVSTVICPARPEQTLDLDVNGALAGTLKIDAATNDPDLVRTIDLPPSVALRDPVIQLDLRPHDTRGPKSFGCGDDERPVGVRLRGIAIE